eukprot:TRINITY_DN21723_c0_g1_i1.p1 TRINITY_DN21723_c0_g1~~TRINITY_DN21723_c0_g1_i1.p1  ORF type:complete len:609 (+),score=20.45 TRINITY_DN21723_c0_g1_i1:151-1977(+)
MSEAQSQPSMRRSQSDSFTNGVDAPREIDYATLAKHSDATRDIGVAVQKQSIRPRRAKSWHGFGTTEPTASTIAQPGGFRREFVLLQGGSSGQSSKSPKTDSATSARSELPPRTVTQSQIRYAEETSLVQQLLWVQECFVQAVDYSFEGDDELIGIDPRLSSTLLPGQLGVQTKGIRSQRQLTFLILKGFVASAIMYLPRCWANGGLICAPLILLATCAMSILSCRKLILCADRMIELRGITVRDHIPSYGDISRYALGEFGYCLVTLSLLVSQLCFCATYIVLIFQNLNEAVVSLLGCMFEPTKELAISVVAIGVIPLVWIRRMKYFAIPSLFGNMFMLCALVAIIIFAGKHMLTRTSSATLQWVNPDSLALSIGTAAYTFEGIGIVIPLYDSTCPELRPQFNRTMTRTLVCVCAFYMFFATVVYEAYAANTQMNVLLNLESGVFKAIVQVLFCFNLLNSYPLTMCPATSILEGQLIRGSGRRSLLVKLKKNMLRSCAVVLTALVACFCAAELNNFVALVGGVCCMPLAVIVPALMHAKLVGGTRLIDCALVLVGVALMVLSTYMAISTWGSTGAPPTLDRCASVVSSLPAGTLGIRGTTESFDQLI